MRRSRPGHCYTPHRQSVLLPTANCSLIHSCPDYNRRPPPTNFTHSADHGLDAQIDITSPIHHTHTHTHTRLTALFPGLPRWAGTRKVKPIWILLKQETVSASGISWAICKSAPRSRPITMPAPHRSVFTGRMPFLPPNQQRQSTVQRQYRQYTSRVELTHRARGLKLCTTMRIVQR